MPPCPRFHPRQTAAGGVGSPRGGLALAGSQSAGPSHGAAACDASGGGSPALRGGVCSSGVWPAGTAGRLSVAGQPGCGVWQRAGVLLMVGPGTGVAWAGCAACFAQSGLQSSAPTTSCPRSRPSCSLPSQRRQRCSCCLRAQHTGGLPWGWPPVTCFEPISRAALRQGDHRKVQRQCCIAAA